MVVSRRPSSSIMLRSRHRGISSPASPACVVVVVFCGGLCVGIVVVRGGLCVGIVVVCVWVLWWFVCGVACGGLWWFVCGGLYLNGVATQVDDDAWVLSNSWQFCTGQ